MKQSFSDNLLDKSEEEEDYEEDVEEVEWLRQYNYYAFPIDHYRDDGPLSVRNLRTAVASIGQNIRA